MSFSLTSMPFKIQKLSPNAIMKTKMATSGFGKTAANDQLPPDMGIFEIVMMHWSHESTSDNILNCKMATFGDWKTAENDPKTTKYGYFINQNDAQTQKLSQNAILKSNMATSGS